jgi:hypothetical protein
MYVQHTVTIRASVGSGPLRLWKINYVQVFSARLQLQFNIGDGWERILQVRRHYV